MEVKNLPIFQFLLFLVKYLAFWVIYFIFFRCLFLAYNAALSADLSFIEIVKTFSYGFTMDLSMAAYLTFLPIIIICISVFINPKIILKIIHAYSVVILIITSFLGILDVGLYSDWGTRLNDQILLAFSQPAAMLACVTTFQLLLLIVVEIVIILLFLFIYKKIFVAKNNTKKPHFTAIFVYLICGALLIIPMRGGLQLTPLNFSSVYFSQKLYANHAAYNPIWSFFYGLMHKEKNIATFSFLEDAECEQIMLRNTNFNETNLPCYIKYTHQKPINVILVIVESFSNKAIEPLGGVAGLTPNFNKLSNEGILFSEFYASGNRSDKGIAALLASYPALIAPFSILYYPDKMTNLDYLCPHFKKNGYHSHFYYAGEVEFYNTKSLLMQSGFDYIVDVKDFPSSQRLQKWGVPDAFFYPKISNDLEKLEPPFFLTTYNISSHPPYDIPTNSVFDYKTAIAYSDSCLGVFINQIKNSKLWDNTLVIITSDHGTLDLHASSLFEPISYKIPMLWLGGAIDTTFVNNQIGMQTDLTETLVQQLGWKTNKNPYSKNLFGKREYAFSFSTNGYLFISPDVTYSYNLEIGQKNILNVQNEQNSDTLQKFSVAFVQYLHQKFRKLK